MSCVKLKVLVSSSTRSIEVVVVPPASRRFFSPPLRRPLAQILYFYIRLYRIIAARYFYRVCITSVSRVHVCTPSRGISAGTAHTAHRQVDPPSLDAPTTEPCPVLVSLYLLFRIRFRPFVATHANCNSPSGLNVL